MSTSYEESTDKIQAIIFIFLEVRCHQLVGLLYQPRTIDDDECVAAGKMRIVRGNRSIQRKPASVLPSPPQIPYDLT